MKSFTFNGISSAEFKCRAFRKDTEKTPGREFTTYPVPGRLGELLRDEKRYPNVPHKYTAIIAENAEENVEAMKNFLASQVGYHRLEDTEHPDEFYLAYVADEIDPEWFEGRHKARFEVEFNRKPQRYLVSGEDVTVLTADGSITNPTRFDARPLLRVYGVGTLYIGAQSVTISAADKYTDIDSEMQECFRGSASRTAYVSVSGTDYPVLAPGVNNITFTGITRVEITPRWFKL